MRAYVWAIILPSASLGALIFLVGATRLLIDLASYTVPASPTSSSSSSSSSHREADPAEYRGYDPTDIELAPVVITTFDRDWHIDMFSQPHCVVGQRCEVTFRFAPSIGWQVNKYYPMKLNAIRDGDGMSFASGLIDSHGDTTLRRSENDVTDAADGSSYIRLVVIPHEARLQHITGKIRVSACDRDVCRIGIHDVNFWLSATNR